MLLETKFYTTLYLLLMSIITIEQFEELKEDYPDLAQCYDLTFTEPKDVEEKPIAYTS